jgi:hypothetical protein
VRVRSDEIECNTGESQRRVIENLDTDPNAILLTHTYRGRLVYILTGRLSLLLLVSFTSVGSTSFR